MSVPFFVLHISAFISFNRCVSGQTHIGLPLQFPGESVTIIGLS